MSLYNAIYGANQATFWVLPMLDKHPNDYPRFRDCFIGELRRSKKEVDPFGIPLRELSDDPHITILTRTGGSNRSSFQEENAILRNHPNYLKDYDDSFDSTFACWIFTPPEKWKEDFDKLSTECSFKTLSKEYVEQVIKVFPKLEGEIRRMTSH